MLTAAAMICCVIAFCGRARAQEHTWKQFWRYSDLPHGTVVRDGTKTVTIAVAHADLDNSLKYRTGINLSNVETIKAAISPTWCDLTIDSNGTPHVISLDPASGLVLHRREQAGVWTSTTVDDNVDIDKRTCITVGPDGVLHVVYVDEQGRLVHAMPGVFGWEKQCLHNGVLSAPRISAANDGSLHVVYRTPYVGGDVLHYQRADYDPVWPEWDNIAVEENAGVRLHTDVRFDSENKPFLVVAKELSTDLKLYGFLPDGLGPVDTVVSPGSTVEAAAMDIDNENNRYVVWMTGTQLGLSLNRSPWRMEIIDNVGYAENTNIGFGVDPFGELHVTYYDGEAGQLVYAHGVPVPEPAVSMLLVTGVGTLAVLRRRRRRRSLSDDGGEPCT